MKILRDYSLLPVELLDYIYSILPEEEKRSVFPFVCNLFNRISKFKHNQFALIRGLNHLNLENLSEKQIESIELTKNLIVESHLMSTIFNSQHLQLKKGKLYELSPSLLNFFLGRTSPFKVTVGVLYESNYFNVSFHSNKLEIEIPPKNGTQYLIAIQKVKLFISYRKPLLKAYRLYIFQNDEKGIETSEKEIEVVSRKQIDHLLRYELKNYIKNIAEANFKTLYKKIKNVKSIKKYNLWIHNSFGLISRLYSDEEKKQKKIKKFIKISTIKAKGYVAEDTLEEVPQVLIHWKTKSKSTKNLKKNLSYAVFTKTIKKLSQALQVSSITQCLPYISSVTRSKRLI